jgi:hypothetical protein
MTLSDMKVVIGRGLIAAFFLLQQQLFVRNLSELHGGFAKMVRRNMN